MEYRRSTFSGTTATSGFLNKADREHIAEYEAQMSLLSLSSNASTTNTQSMQKHELLTVPIFTGRSKKLIDSLAAFLPVANGEKTEDSDDEDGISVSVLKKKRLVKGIGQYALLAASLELVRGTRSFLPTKITGLSEGHQSLVDPRVMLNVAAPLSVFICGLQGSGKSHTMSCLLENCLLPSPQLGALPHPLHGLIFHYDALTSVSTPSPCEAAYLASHIPVRVLVSVSNYTRMEALYASLPGNISVHPLQFSERDINISRLLTLMSVDNSNHTPLYMECITSILREMATKSANTTAGIDYAHFKAQIEAQKFSRQQKGSLSQRIEILESFLDLSGTNNSMEWKADKGTLTIVDMSDPFVDDATACALFDICLGLFLESNPLGTVVGLDEAHKYMGSSSSSAQKLTSTVLALIRQQRHYGARVIISTQEPAISPRLLDLVNIHIIHRFASPEWLGVLQRHCAALMGQRNDEKGDDGSGMKLMERICGLREGEALMLAPTGLVVTGEFYDGREGEKLEKLGMRFLKVKIRGRITEDGGKSKLTM